jgi:hypothetical protein
MWEFAVGLFMLQVWPDSLLLVAIYGLVETASVATLGVVVGELVDKCPRLRVRILHNFYVSYKHILFFYKKDHHVLLWALNVAEDVLVVVLGDPDGTAFIGYTEWIRRSSCFGYRLALAPSRD